MQWFNVSELKLNCACLQTKIYEVITASDIYLLCNFLSYYIFYSSTKSQYNKMQMCKLMLIVNIIQQTHTK